MHVCCARNTLTVLRLQMYLSTWSALRLCKILFNSRWTYTFVSVRTDFYTVHAQHTYPCTPTRTLSSWENNTKLNKWSFRSVVLNILNTMAWIWVKKHLKVRNKIHSLFCIKNLSAKLVSGCQLLCSFVYRWKQTKWLKIGQHRQCPSLRRALTMTYLWYIYIHGQTSWAKHADKSALFTFNA